MNRIFALHFLTSFSHFIFHFISYIIYENLTAPPTAAAAAAAATAPPLLYSLFLSIFFLKSRQHFALRYFCIHATDSLARYFYPLLLAFWKTDVKISSFRRPQDGQGETKN